MADDTNAPAEQPAGETPAAEQPENSAPAEQGEEVAEQQTETGDNQEKPQTPPAEASAAGEGPSAGEKTNSPSTDAAVEQPEAPAELSPSQEESVGEGKPVTPTAEQEDKPATPVVEAKPASPAGSQKGSRPPSAAGSNKGSRPPSAVGSKKGSKPGSPAGSKPASPAPGSKPITPAPESEAKPATPAEAEAKPVTPAEGEAKPATPAEGETKPATPTEGELKPATPAEGEVKPETPAEGEAKPATPTEGEAKPATPAEGEAKPATPAEGEAKPATPTEGEAKPTTPAEGEAKPETPAEGEAKPATPAEGEAKPATPPATEEAKPGSPSAEEQPKASSKQGSKAGTPTGSRQGSKPGTPTGSRQGSKPGTPTGSRQGSKPPSPSGSKPGSKQGSKPGTPTGSKQGSKPPSRAGSKAGSTGSPHGSKQGSRAGTPAAEEKPVGVSAEPSFEGGIPPAPPITGGPFGTSAISEDKEPSSTLNMMWSFGLNKNVPVLNLSDENRKVVMYTCAHTGVVYDFANNKQMLLQGHSNAISCTCVSEDKRWLATADRGTDALIIVWDTFSGVPVRTIFDSHPDGGVIAMAMTPDAKYLATLSGAETQTLSIWDWTVEGETPICTAELSPSYGQQTYILFNPEDVTQVVTNSDTQVIFYSWKTSKLVYFAPPLSDEDFNKPVGRYSQSVFLRSSTRALTATSLGNLVVWDTNKPLTQMVRGESTPDKKAMKLVRLQERGINVITYTNGYIVTGDSIGHVKFFDGSLKLMNWYQDFHLGPVNSLGFAYLPEFAEVARPSSSYPPDATIVAKQFALRDFVVGTTTAVYAHVKTDGTDVKIILRDHDAAVHALASHPSEHRIFVGSYSGLLQVWDYQKKKVVISRWFKHGQMIRCCSIDPKGEYLAVGFTNGSVRILDATSLQDVCESFHYARDAITHLAFAHNSRYLASADADYAVSVFKATGESSDEPWIYLGRYRAHYKLVQSVTFGVQLDSDSPRLMSLGKDRVLVEYDLENSGKDDLRILSMDRIEQSAVPLCMAWYPPVTKESFIVTANDQYKFKLYNSTTKMCRKTLLGPTYGTPIHSLVILPTADAVNDNRYLAYVTDDKIGIHKLPLDGNPHNAMALISHPQGVVNLAASHDGKFVFTAGGVDATVHMWGVNTDALEAQSKLGGEELEPFYGLLDGGRDGELFRELEDYFYYAQIRSQGVDTTEMRQVSTRVPLSEIPYVMRAMGFYPSEQEVDDMLNEVKFSNYVESGQYTSEIDLGDFIKLYINHRPAFGLQPELLMAAFESLGFQAPGGIAIDRGDLLDMLQTRGEHMTEYELAEYLTTLLGYNEEGGSSELQEFDTTQAGDIIEDLIPEEVTADMFCNDLLGFGMYNEGAASERGASVLPLEQRSPQVTFS